MPLFFIASLAPFALIAAGILWGGAWPWLALGYMAALVAILDRLLAHQTRNADPQAEFPLADPLLILLGLLHFALLGACVWAVAGAQQGLAWPERVALGIAGGMVLGQISHPVAHELIHRPARGKRLLGRLIYTSLLVGHHVSAHLRVHHVHVGSDADPNSAPLGMGFYRFAPRATLGSFRAGLAAETRLRRGAGRGRLSHPYMLYVGGGLAALLLVGLVLGWAGMLSYLALCLYAQMQILLSDYVQHYGLRRKPRADGRPEPVGPQHSWNAPHRYSAAVTVNAPRHSDHHVTPSRPYPALQLDRATMPILPHPLPVMAALALVPPLWRRVMDRRCAQWA